MMQKRSFTILEMVVALVIFGLIFSAIMTIYTRMINVKREFDARNYLLSTTYNMVEKMNILLKDYTIDYEQYFNRRMYGCAGTPWLMTGWNHGTTWYCSVFNGYGNSNPTDALQSMGASPISTWTHHLYRCSSVGDFLDDTTFSYAIYWAGLLTGAGCPLIGERQAFGEYRYQFVDVKDNADETPSVIGDDDDTDLWVWPAAIADNENIPELYLISKDKRSRLLFRRKLVQQNDINNDGTYQSFERLYVIQMLQLRGFDAGTKHSFNAGDSDNQYMYDGQIDTRACDYEKGFICNWPAVNGSIYTGYHLPSNAEDGWVNLFGWDMTVSSWRLQIYPTKDPIYARSEKTMQSNPYVRLFMQTHLYAPSRYTKVDVKAMGNITYELQTMFNIKSNY